MPAIDAVLTPPQRWDGCGVILSALCIGHCLALPLLAAVAPAVVAAEAQTHAGLALAILVVGLLAFTPGYRMHRRLRIPLAGCLGIGLMAVPLLLPDTAAGEPAEAALTVAGGLLMVASHLGNAWYCRYCPRCADGRCELRPETSRGKP